MTKNKIIWAMPTHTLNKDKTQQQKNREAILKSALPPGFKISKDKNK